MAIPGLNAINTAATPDAESNLPPAQIETTAPKGSNLKGNIPINAADTGELLAKMQEAVNDYENPLAKLSRGLTLGMATARGPSSLAAIQREQNLQEKQMMDYSQTAAAYQAAGKQAERNATNYASKMGLTGGAGAGAAEGAKATPGTYGGVPMDDYIKAQLTGQPDHDTPILEKWLSTKSLEKTKAENNPASLARQPVVILNPNTKQPEVRDVNMFEYWDLKAKGLIKQPSEYYESEGKPAAAPATTSGKAVSTASSLNIPIISGDRDVAKQSELYEKSKQPGYTGAPVAAPGTSQHQLGNAIDTGPITAEQRQQLIDAGFTQPLPKTDPNHWELRPTGNGVLMASNNQGFPDVSSILAQRKIQEEEGTAAAKKRGESGEEKRATFETDIMPSNIAEEKATAQRIQTLVKNNPGITGVLSGEGYAKAIAGQLERGIGNVSVNDLSTAILQTLPTTTNLTMSERNELGTYLARMELKAAKLIKGQGQITEGEREILKHASSSLKDPAEAVYKKAKMLERIADMNAELGDIYGNGSKYPNFRDFVFSKDPRVLDIHKRYQKDLENILNEKVDFRKPVSGTPQKSQHPEDIQAILDRNKAKTK